ncbi:MAG: hypothetical protein OCC49_08500 [Fibrobacterales bacterium]
MNWILSIILILGLSLSICGQEPTASRSRRDILGPVKKVGVKPHTNPTRTYRSAKKAFFLSLAFPGSGQVYVGGQKMNYIKAGLFTLSEAALIGGWYYYSIKKYDDKLGQANSFADRYFNNFIYDSLTTLRSNPSLPQSQINLFASNYLGSARTQFCAAIYGPEEELTNKCTTNAHKVSKDPKDKSRHNIVLKNNQPIDKSRWYGTIESSALILGWDDVVEVPAVYDGSPLGSSDHYTQYISLREKAREYESLRGYFFVGVLLNHLVSAVDALFAAEANNAALYDGKMVWYRNIHFESDTYLSGLDITSDLTIALRF